MQIPVAHAAGARLPLHRVQRESTADVDARARECVEALGAEGGLLDARVYTDPGDQEQVRESGLGATAFVPGEPDTWPGWEDSAVPPGKVGPYLRDLRTLFDRYGYRASLYGHVGQGCIAEIPSGGRSGTAIAATVGLVVGVAALWWMCRRRTG